MELETSGHAPFLPHSTSPLLISMHYLVCKKTSPLMMAAPGAFMGSQRRRSPA